MGDAVAAQGDFPDFLTDPVAEMRREPADHDLIGVLVPEEVDPHAIAVFVASPADDVVL